MEVKLLRANRHCLSTLARGKIEWQRESMAMCEMMESRERCVRMYKLLGDGWEGWVVGGVVCDLKEDGSLEHGDYIRFSAPA